LLPLFATSLPACQSRAVFAKNLRFSQYFSIAMKFRFSCLKTKQKTAVSSKLARGIRGKSVLFSVITMEKNWQKNLKIF